jgi:hypothetical protein
MVVLLDEVEKADPSLFDVLLQVLGEGRLTDGAGRVADFTNAVVIMTSNLGAETYGRTTAGFSGDSAQAASAGRHFEREVKAFLRPEMFNRLDRIVGFTPLGAEVIGEIARREVRRVAERDGLRMRDAPLEVSPESIARLAAEGYDPKYGARPLKRVIERRLVAPLADRLCRLGAAKVRRLQVDLADGAPQIDAEVLPAGKVSDEEQGTVAELTKVVDLRRKVQALVRSNALMRLKNEIARLRQLEKQRLAKLKRRGKEATFEFTPEQARIMAQEDLLTRSETLLKDVRRLENDACGEYYSRRKVDLAGAAELRRVVEEALAELLFEIYRMQSDARGSLIVAVFGASRNRVGDLVEAYEHVCAGASAGIDRYWLKMYDPQLDQWPVRAGDGRGGRKPSSGPGPILRLLHRKRTDDDVPAKVVDVYRPEPHRFHSPPDDVIGLAFQVVDSRAAALLETEAGRHEFVRVAGKPESCFVEMSASGIFGYSPPADCGRAGSFADLALRRTYDLAAEVCRDPMLNEEFDLRGKSIRDAVARAAAEYLVQRTWRLLDDGIPETE